MVGFDRSSLHAYLLFTFAQKIHKARVSFDGIVRAFSQTVEFSVAGQPGSMAL
jgi:hypothetical protein